MQYLNNVQLYILCSSNNDDDGVIWEYDGVRETAEGGPGLIVLKRKLTYIYIYVIDISQYISLWLRSRRRVIQPYSHKPSSQSTQRWLSQPASLQSVHIAQPAPAGLSPPSLSERQAPEARQSFDVTPCVPAPSAASQVVSSAPQVAQSVVHVTPDQRARRKR